MVLFCCDISSKLCVKEAWIRIFTLRDVDMILLAETDRSHSAKKPPAQNAGGFFINGQVEKTLLQERNREGRHVIVIPVRHLDGSDNGENNPRDDDRGSQHEADQDKT